MDSCMEELVPGLWKKMFKAMQNQTNIHMVVNHTVANQFPLEGHQQDMSVTTASISYSSLNGIQKDATSVTRDNI